MKLGFVDEPSFTWKDMGKAILYLLKDKKKSYFYYTSVLFIVLFYDLIPTLVIAKVVDFFTNYKTGDSLQVFYGYVIFLAVTSSIIAIIRLSTKGKLSNIQSEIAYFTRVRGFEKLLDFSVKWHGAENTGNKVQKIQNGVNALKETQTLISNGIFPQITSIIGVTGAFLFINPLFFLYCLAYIGMFIFIQASFYQRILKMNYTYNLMLEKASGTYYEGLSNILTIKTLGVTEDYKKNIVSKEELSRDFSIKMTRLGTNKWTSFQILNGVVMGGILFLTGHNFVLNMISLGSVFIIFNYFQKLSNALGESTNLLDKLIRAKVSLARMMPIFWENEIKNEGTMDFPKHWDNISIVNASFNYEDKNESNVNKSEMGLKEISLNIKKYEKIGVVGKSGSGKSTLAKLLLGLYEFDTGQFKIGNTDFYEIRHDDITNEIALVLQDSEMFNLSLLENITLMRVFDEKLFQRAISIAQLEELILRLPQGTETLIGEKGHKLSGGERQRIGIVRAIYKDPQILVLDEATSSLDSKTESLIQEAFEKNLEKKTVISIAHRVSTLKNVDKIIVFDGGKIVEEGTFESLVNNKNSKFFEVYQYQRETMSK